jgi:Holliday junction resolvasome RuvABC endonuclease subunit
VVNYRNEMDRYSKLAEKLLAFILDYKNPMVYLEGYSMGSKGLIFNIAENTAVFKYLCFCNDVPVITVPPTTIKKYVTGKGNATKDVMYDVFVKDTSVDLQNALFNKSRKLGNPVTDLVDAYYIAKWGQEQFDGTGQEAKKEATTET